VAVNKATKQEIFMKMDEFQPGLGLGAAKFRLVFVFATLEALNSFVTPGWEAGANAMASAKTKTEGGALAGLGAALALAHPATVLSSAIVAPFTTLHPMIAAGWISGMVEAFSRKPKVKDLERLPEDILSFKGFWRNKVTRILLVVAFTNLGASVGTLVAFPVIVKILLG
jgi:hypothetical protein